MSARTGDVKLFKSLSLPFIGALFIHALVAVLLFGSWSLTPHKSASFELPKHITAKVVTLEKQNPVTESKPAPKAIPKTAPKPKPATVTKPKEKVAVTKPVAPTEKTVNISKEKPKEVPKADEVEKTDTGDKVLVKDEKPEDLFANMMAGLAAEEQSITQKIVEIEENNVRSEQIKAQVNDYVAVITKQIEEKWSRPVELRLMDLADIEAKVSVEILPTGELQNASIVMPSGNANYDQSVLRAIEKVRRFNVPDDSEVFEAGGFRRLNITFRPEDLMKP